jgi:hypothetical protein
VYHTKWNHFPADYDLKHLSLATSGETRLSEVTCYVREIFFCFICLPYVCSNVCYSQKNKRTEHWNLFLLLLIINFFYFKNSEEFGTRSYLMCWGRDTCVILRLWVILEVLIRVSVKRAVVLIVTTCRLIEIYHPSYFYHEVIGGRFLHLYSGKRASYFPQNICKFVPDCVSRKMKFSKHWGSVWQMFRFMYLVHH